MPVTISDGLTLIAPTAGDENYSTSFVNDFATPISGHDHTGSPNGSVLGTSALSDNAVTDAKIRLTNDGYLKARNAANSADVDLLKLSSSDKLRLASAQISDDTRADLGLAIGTNVQAYDAGLVDIAGLAVTDGNIIVGDGTNWVAESGATARASLGLGGYATLSPVFYSAYNGSAQTLTGTVAVVNCSTALADSGSGAFSNTSGVITFNTTGFYYISYKLAFEVNTNNGDSEIRAYIDAGGTPLTGSQSKDTFEFASASGFVQTLSGGFIYDVSSSDDYSLKAEVSDGTSTFDTIPEYCTINIIRLGPT